MKSEHRHELKTNELGKLAARMAPFFERYGNQMLWGLCAVILVVAGIVYWMRTSTAAASSGWSQLAVATTAEEFANVADSYPNTVVGAWARLQEAEAHLGNGIELMFVDRSAAVSDLEDARDSFEGVLRNKSATPEVRERALFGLARCLEALSDGNTEPAIAAYQRLLSEFPETVYKEQAEDRIADLQAEETQEFYAWFHNQNPEPADRPEPQDGQPPDPSALERLREGASPSSPLIPQQGTAPDGSSAREPANDQPGSVPGGLQFPPAQASDADSDSDAQNGPQLRPPEENDEPGDASDRPNDAAQPQ